MAKVIVHYYAAARAATGLKSETCHGHDLAEVLSGVATRHGERCAQVLAHCSFAVDGAVTTSSSTVLTDDARIDVLPPFAGGSA